MQSINPFNGQVIKEYSPDNLVSVQAKLQSLQLAYLTWKTLPLDTRIDVIKQVADLLEKNKIEYALIMTAEMGKVKTQAIQEVEKCALLCKYYMANAKKFLEPQIIHTESSKSYVQFSPLGIILGIMPWNFPFWQVFRFAIPSLLAGNVAMLKHAGCVPGCALAIEAIFASATEDHNMEIFKNILLDSKEMANVIAEPLVQAVSLTGSVEAGKSVASIAGSHIKKTVLELGGSDPYIVLADADVTNAAITCAKARLINCGQSCIAAKRFIVAAEVYDEFLELFVAYFSKLKIGDPSLDDTVIGPLANKQILDTVIAQVDKSLAAGATCHVGGKKVPGDGYFFEPTVLSNIPRSSPAATEEIFGPVASVFKVENEREAIDLANNTQFGLGAAIFSQNIQHAMEIAEQHINAGNVFINTHVVSDPHLPFGGVKQSGYGRELSAFGIHEFVNIKSIKID